MNGTHKDQKVIRGKELDDRAHDSRRNVDSLTEPRERLQAHRNASHEHMGGQNLNSGERIVSGITGGVLAIAGLRSRGVGGALALLGGAALLWRSATGRCAAYEAAGISSRGGKLHPVPFDERRAQQLDRAIEIAASPREIYRQIRDFKQLSTFHEDIIHIGEYAPGQHHWVTSGYKGNLLEWDTAITEEREDVFVAWETEPDAPVAHRAAFYLEPGPDPRTTFLHLVVDYMPVGGRLGLAAARAFGFAPEQIAQELLEGVRRAFEAGSPAQDEEPYPPTTH